MKNKFNKKNIIYVLAILPVFFIFNNAYASFSQTLTSLTCSAPGSTGCHFDTTTQLTIDTITFSGDMVVYGGGNNRQPSLHIGGITYTTIAKDVYTGNPANFVFSFSSPVVIPANSIDAYVDHYGIYYNSGSEVLSLYSPPTCSPDTILNGTIGAYPTCAISCNGGYELTGGSCVAVQSGGSGSMTISTSTTSGVYAMVSGMIGDPGFLGVVALSVGIPLTVFYIIPSIIGLFPGRKKKK